jgi:hypothetical protein
MIRRRSRSPKEFERAARTKRTLKQVPIFIVNGSVDSTALHLLVSTTYAVLASSVVESQEKNGEPVPH